MTLVLYFELIITELTYVVLIKNQKISEGDSTEKCTLCNGSLFI